MEIASLLGHTAQLLKFIQKSHQPADFITSQYFRQKKYIGSHDRKFISEALFLSLRMNYLSENIINTILEQDNQLIIPNNDAETINQEYLIVLASSLISELYKSSGTKEIISVFKSLPYYNENIISVTIKSISSKFNLPESDINQLVENIKQNYTLLEKNINAIYTRKLVISDEELNLISIRYSIQPWILKELLTSKYFKLNVQQACLLAESLLLPAPLTLRANFNDIYNAITELNSIGIDAMKSYLAPKGIIINKRLDLNILKLFKDGLLEVQDEGSQLISYALNPQKSEFVLDACAGGGGKTLHIASIMNDSGRIIATDLDVNKLKELNKRASRFGYKSIETVSSNNFEKFAKYFEFDKIIIDAPCSGMGTVRRNPMLKWWLTPATLLKYQIKQLQILNYYSKYLIPGGSLIYSTCSIMSAENHEVVAKFLNDNDNFSPEPIKPGFDLNNVKGIDIDENDYQLQLLPSIHNCDGFFMAKLRKND